MLALLACALLAHSATIAQTNLGGMQNTYARVYQMRPCMLTVDYAGAFQDGDTIIIIQMGGATADRDGNLTSINKAGYWEMNVVGGDPSDDIIPLKRQIFGYPDSFDIGRGVQVVRLPRVPGDATITSELIGFPWDPSAGTGGVIALSVPGILTLNADINADGLGFGHSFRELSLGRNSATCGATDLNPVEDAGYKGEGIANTERRIGRGPWATAGGGGANHNSGGGGGGNYGAGGVGGGQLVQFSCTPVANGGIGGQAYTSYSMPNPHIVMGSGGGAGHQNNMGGTDGARGGGLIIIIAKEIRVNGNRLIRSNGADALPAFNDGAGGGGSGGTIAIFSNTLGSNVRFQVKGGKGGDINGVERTGPGGGGGGGVVLSRNAIPAGSVDASGGFPGTQIPFSANTQGAQYGQSGAALSGLGDPLKGNVAVYPLVITASGPIEFCAGDSVVLKVNAFTAKWSKQGDPTFFKGGESIVVREPGRYTAEATLGGCELATTKEIKVWGKPRFGMGGGKYLPPCGISRFMLGIQTADGGVPPYTYKWETDDPEALDPGQLDQPMLWATPTKDTWFKVSVTDANGCQYVEEFNYKYAQPIIYSAPDVETCEGEDIQIGVVGTGGAAPLVYSWEPATGLDNPRLSRPTVIAPTANQRYIVHVIDDNGCHKFDTIEVRVKALPKTTVSPSTVICSAASTQLVATGGTSYVWEPATGLSCTTCPNPVARPAVTTTYRVLITDAKGCVKLDSVTVVVRTPRLSSTTTAIDFGKLDECQTSTTREFYLRNDDNSDIEITDQTFTNADGFAVIAPGLPATIKAHDSIRIVVSFAPPGIGSRSSDLTIKGLCDVSYRVSLTGEQQSTVVSANLGVVNFGQAFYCEAAPRDTVVIVSNTGTAPLDLGNVVITAPFQSLYPTGTQRLLPGDTAHFVIRYTPAGAGVFASDFEIPYVSGTCEGTLRVKLNATNVQPMATADMAGITFPELVGCNLLADTIITIRNTGSVPVDVRRNAITNSFRITSTLPMTIPPGESRTLTVRFEPVAQGSANGELTLLYGPCHDTIRVALSGSSQGVSFTIPETIEFGQIVYCEEQSRTMQLPIINTSAGDAISTITAVSVVGPFTTTLAVGDVLPNNVPQRFDVVFTPTTDGDVVGRIEITLEPCDVKRVIELTGSRADAAIAAASALSVDFGSIQLNTTSRQTVRFRNTGATTLSNVTLNGIITPFSVVSSTPPVPANLAPGEELVVEVEYTGTAGTQNGVLRAVSEEPCVLAAQVQLRGEGDVSSTSVELPAFSAAPGTKVIVPMLATGTGELAGLGVTFFEATLRFNRSLLIPANAAPIVLVNSVPDPNDPSQLLYTFRAPFQPGPTLVELAFIAALGETSGITPVTIEKFAWSDPSITVSLTNGTFQLEEICVTGPTRVIRGSGEVVLKPVRPNPVNTTMELEYEIVEHGPTELFISDLLGRKVAVLVHGEAQPGRYVMTVDASRLESGTYIYTLQTPTQRLSKMMEVVK